MLEKKEVGGLNDKELKVNQQIQFEKVRVSDDNGEIGILSRAEALQLSSQRGLDLILITEKANPPVCRITNAGKFRYEQQKKEKANKKKQAETKIEIKEIRIRPGTDNHDLEVKVKQIRQFLTKGNHVKILVRFRGREISNQSLGREKLKFIIDRLDSVRYIKDIASSGREMSATIAIGEN
jgi:translation initiation factor IF-3